MRPMPPPLRPPGPVVQQPMAGPPNQPAHCVRLGQKPTHKSSRVAGRPSPRIKDLTAVCTIRWNKNPGVQLPCNPSPFLFVPLRLPRTGAAAGGSSLWPALAGDGEGRRRLAQGHDGLSNSFPFFSFTSHLP
jgi:hypothetical protein